MTLYDLRVEVVLRPGGSFVCGHREGEAFRVEGENLVTVALRRFRERTGWSGGPVRILRRGKSAWCKTALCQESLNPG